MTGPTPAAVTTLEVQQLVKRHGQREVLSGLSLTMSQGQVGVLIGPSGSGKSTVLRCINGLEAFDAGRVRIAGSYELAAGQSARERDRNLRALRRRVGMVFQQFNLFPHLNVLHNVITAPMLVLGQPRGQAVAQATQLLARVGLGDRLGAMPSQLSGGQQQRVAIARTLAMSPEIILFDEPTSALDPKMTAEVLGVMTDLAREGQSMLVVTHAMNFARRVAHQVHVLHAGTIAEAGPPDQVFGNPRHEVTREFLRQAETL